MPNRPARTALLLDPSWRAEPRQISRALAEVGFRCSLHTSFYVTPRSLLARLLAAVPLRTATRARAYVLRRYRPDHELGRTVSWVVHDAFHRLLSRAGVAPHVVNLIGNVVYDGWISSVVRRPRDVVICMSGSGLRTMRRQSARGAATVLVMNTPAVATEHRVMADEERRLGLPPSPLAERAGRRLARRIELELEVADLVLANSQFTRDDLVRNGVPSEKIAVTSLGVDLGIFAPRTEVPAASVARVIYVGSLLPRKGVVHLAEAVRRVRRTHACELHAYGTGDPAYVEHLAEYVADGTLVLHPFVPHAELLSVYTAAHVAVLPTLSDGFGLVVYEAMACGVPVVVTDRCGAEVEDGRNGLVVPHRDPEALAAALERLLADPALAASLAQAGLETARAASWERYRAVVAQTISAFVDAHRARS